MWKFLKGLFGGLREIQILKNDFDQVVGSLFIGNGFKLYKSESITASFITDTYTREATYIRVQFDDVYTANLKDGDPNPEKNRWWITVRFGEGNFDFFEHQWSSVLLEDFMHSGSGKPTEKLLFVFDDFNDRQNTIHK